MTGRKIARQLQICEIHKDTPAVRTVKSTCQLMKCCLRLGTAGIFLLSVSHGAEIVLVRGDSTRAQEQERSIDLAATIYGLTVQTVTIQPQRQRGSIAAETEITKALGQKSTAALAIQADALPLIEKEKILKATQRETTASIPILVFGVNANSDFAALKAWTDGRIVGATTLAPGSAVQVYTIGRAPAITGQLSGAKFTFESSQAYFFKLDDKRNTEQIAAVKEGEEERPVVVGFSAGPSRFLVACELTPFRRKVTAWGPQEILRAFPSIAAAFMFVRYSAGERGWHAVGHYANLTIDDAWLRESYGYLDYENLLAEMKRHNFHTTIAFIPWNYDRSEPKTASLIRNHPDRFSICVHGDNHDHKEFSSDGGKSLARQIVSVKQALGRMDRFQALTGVPYDKVMVFPHSIGGEGVLAGLKTYNYLATVNGWNVPMDRVNPIDLSFALRPVTLSYGDFPSVSRYSAEVPIPNSLIALGAFLDNPMLFYGHHGMFANGIGAFDTVADEVNKVEPTIKWRSLGEIVKHLYLVKLRDDSSYDVLALSNSISLENTSSRDAVFHVRKQERKASAINKADVDGRPYPYDVQGDELTMTLSVPRGQTRSVAIEYRNDLTTAPADISKNSALVYVLRMASDFRDITLPKLPLGEKLVVYYYVHDMTPTQLCTYAALLLAAGLLTAEAFRRLVAKSSRPASPGINHGIDQAN
jgi:peptidoglycan/xylan/chitin deacetylase (PgdA/CDA1 family)